MYKKILTVCALTFLFNETIFASNNEAYVDGSKPFVAIKDVNRQGEAWAVCAAAYDVMSEVFNKSHPEQSKKMKELGNGAALAITMALVADGMKEDISPTRFDALWKYAQVAGKEWPKISKTTILADSEALGTKGSSKFSDKMNLTIKICIDNIKSQQAYIDSWRALAKSGLLKLK